MSKLAGIVIAATLALPVAPAAAQDGPVLSVQRTRATVATDQVRKCRGSDGSASRCHTKTRTGHVLVDMGRGFRRVGSRQPLEIGNRVRIKSPAIAVLSYESGCELTLRRSGIYIVRTCDEELDRDQDPDQEDSEEEDSNESEDTEDPEDLDSRDSTRASGRQAMLTPSNLLLTGAGLALGKAIYEEFEDNEDNKDGTAISP